MFLGFSGLSYDTNETVLRDAFQQFGDIIEGKSGSDVPIIPVYWDFFG